MRSECQTTRALEDMRWCFNFGANTQNCEEALLRSGSWTDTPIQRLPQLTPTAWSAVNR